MAGLGSTPSLIVGIGAGAAASAAFEPALEIPRQNAWQDAPNRIIDPSLLAALVAQGGVDLTTAQPFAHRNGYDDQQLAALVYLAQTVPGAAEAMHLWRLGFINDDLFTHTLVKAGVDQRYIGPLLQTKTEELIGLGDIAYAVVRGILPSPSYVPVPPPTSGTKVPRFPQVPIDPEELAAKIGYSPEALQVMVGRSGLSMAPVMAAQALFRSIIAADDYLMAIAEGDLRTEWADAVREVSRAIPTPGEYAELQLRGFLTAAERDTGAARHGMVSADAGLLYDVKGRAPNIHAVTTGLARGGNYDGTPQTIPEPFLSAVQRADIRPEWYDIEYANRYTYPSAFVLRTLATAGDLGDQAAVEQVLLEIGWKPEFAKTVSTAWVGGTGTTDKNVTSAQTHLKTTAHKSYVAYEISDATATTALEAAGVPAASVPAMLSLWQAERELIRKSLSAAQIKKALSTSTTNPDTGQPWTQAEAIARLLELGYDQVDAETFLAE